MTKGTHQTYPRVQAPHGTELSCKGWSQEGALRMLMNNLDAEVAEKPQSAAPVKGAAPRRRAPKRR